eukprot:jgi/Bigna1/84295/fgenesh1_pg.128_\
MAKVSESCVINISFGEVQQRVRFFKGTSYEALQQICKDVHGLDRSLSVLIRDQDGVAVALSDGIPHESTFRLEIIKRKRKQPSSKVDGSGKSRSGPKQNSIKKQQKKSKLQCITPSGAHSSNLVSDSNLGRKTLFTKSPSQSETPSSQGNENQKSKKIKPKIEKEEKIDWKVGDVCEAKVDGTWRKAKVIRVRKGRISISIADMLGKFMDKPLRPIANKSMKPVQQTAERKLVSSELETIQNNMEDVEGIDLADNSKSFCPELSQLPLTQKDVAPKMLPNSSQLPATLDRKSFTNLKFFAAKGSCPPPLWGATMTTAHDGKVILHGGNTADSTHDHLYCFNSHSGEWTELAVDRKPQARAWHSATYVPDQSLIFIFGGDNIFFRLLLVILHQHFQQAQGESVSSRRNPKVLSEPLLLDTGCNGVNFFNEVFCLNLKTWTWSQPKVIGESPEPRGYHAATPVGSCLVICGGNDRKNTYDSVWILNTELWIWQKMDNINIPALTGHKSILIGETIFYAGGWNTQEEEEDRKCSEYVIALDTKTWQMETVTACPFFSRVGHNLTVVKNRLVMFGGRGAGGVLNSDLYLSQ